MEAFVEKEGKSTTEHINLKSHHSLIRFQNDVLQKNKEEVGLGAGSQCVVLFQTDVINHYRSSKFLSAFE